MLTALLVGSLAAIATIWVAYPVVVHVVALFLARRTPPAREGAPRPRVSVVLASRDANDVIAERVADLLRADYPEESLEVVVSVDSLRRGPLPSPSSNRVRVVAGDDPGGKAAALNAGVRAATGDVLVFADARQRFAPDAVGALVDRLSLPGVAAVSGRLELPERTVLPLRWYWCYERALRRAEAALHSTVGVTGAIWAMRRPLWTALPSGLLLDDVYTPLRLVGEGWRVDFADAARAVETRSPRPTQEYHRKVRTLAGVVQVCAWLPGVLLPHRNPVAIQFLFHKLLRLTTPYLLLLALVSFVVLVVGAGHGSELLAFGGMTAIALLAAPLGGDRLRRSRDAALNVVLLQAATVMGTLFGVRRQWSVWSR